MDHELTSAEIFPHVRIVMGIIIGMGITRLLTGLARFVQHPARGGLSLIHLAWVGTMLLMLMHFWWWEVALYDIRDWSFGVFFFLTVYTIVLFLMSALLFPDASGNMPTTRTSSSTAGSGSSVFSPRPSCSTWSTHISRARAISANTAST